MGNSPRRPKRGTKKQEYSNAAVSSYPRPLSAEDESRYISQYENGDAAQKKQAKDTLVERNLRLVAHIVKKYNHPETEDLISIGTIGLIKGIANFDSERQVKLSTYCSRCIENEIRMYLRSSKKHNGDVSIHESIGSDKEGNSITLEDRLADDSEDLTDIVDLKIQVKFLYDRLRDTLTEREREIVELRYGLASGKEVTQREIGEMLGISRSYVSRIEKKALEKLFDEFKKSEEKKPCPWYY